MTSSPTRHGGGDPMLVEPGLLPIVPWPDHIGVVGYGQGTVGIHPGSTNIGSPPACRVGLLVISSRMPLSKLQARFYYPELDSIRFFLFCGVWVYHTLPREEGPYSVHHVPMPLAVGITSIIKASGLWKDGAISCKVSEEHEAHKRRGLYSPTRNAFPNLATKP